MKYLYLSDKIQSNIVLNFLTNITFADNSPVGASGFGIILYKNRSRNRLKSFPIIFLPECNLMPFQCVHKSICLAVWLVVVRRSVYVLNRLVFTDIFKINKGKFSTKEVYHSKPSHTFEHWIMTFNTYLRREKHSKGRKYNNKTLFLI